MFCMRTHTRIFEATRRRLQTPVLCRPTVHQRHFPRRSILDVQLKQVEETRWPSSHDGHPILLVDRQGRRIGREFHRQGGRYSFFGRFLFHISSSCLLSLEPLDNDVLARRWDKTRFPRTTPVSSPRGATQLLRLRSHYTQIHRLSSSQPIIQQSP